MSINENISKIKNGESLSRDVTYQITQEILSSKVSEEQTIEFLKSLASKGETNDELLGMLDSMEDCGVHITPNTSKTIIDVCGTGGDKMKTFNISTAASFVIAASGGVVAKHGNRSVTGISGSADVFEYFGYDLNSSPEDITKMIEKYGIGFMFAQKFHPAMKNVSSARKKIDSRTAFNLLGPLSNPARVKNQLIGVFSDEFLERIPQILIQKDAQNIITVRSEDGLDEFSTSANNKICILKDRKLEKSTINPQELGLEKSDVKDIQISTKEEAIKSFVDVIKNTANQTMIDVTALNAAGGLIVSNVAKDFQQGLDIAQDTIKNGKAYDLLGKFLEEYGDVKKLQGMN